MSDDPAADGAASPVASDDLRAACETLGLNVLARQIAAMWRYLDLLQRWNSTYNLTAVREPGAMVTQHLVDCLAAVAALERSGVVAGGGRVLDVGSGGGLPGVLLAILRADWSVTCLDAVGKKAAFVRQVAGALDLPNLRAVHARVEQWPGEPFDLVTARAFASLTDLARLSERLLKRGGQWMAMKGQVPDAEIAALPPDIEAFHVEQLLVPGLDAHRCLVWMRRRQDAAGPTAAAAEA